MTTLPHRTEAHSLNTPLNHRTLWFDGDSSFRAQDITRSLQRFTDVKYVDEVTTEIKQYNKTVSREHAIKVKEECRKLERTWNIPPEYLHLDLVGYLADKHIALSAKCSEEESNARDYRLITELALYKKRGLYDMLRAIIWIINTLTANDVVWGVGRGSSVSSYVLYVIGVHDVDSYAYDLDIDDFFHN